MVKNKMNVEGGADGVFDIEVLSGEFLQNKIYNIRGQKVMIDSDLAEIYGYETRYLNRQVKNNIEKFEGEDFMFQLTKKEVDNLKNGNVLSSVMCKNFTSRDSKDAGALSSNLALSGRNIFKGQDGGTRKLPYAFTEQGIYMLMTVLRGPLAVKQSRTLVRLFKTMKDYIVENQEKMEYKSSLQLAMRVIDNTRDMNNIKNELNKLDSEMDEVNRKLGEMVMRSEISPIMLDFNKVIEQKEYVFLNGEPMRASELYMDIYSKAKQNIYIIDDYISIKTLKHLKNIKPGIKVTIFSDNKKHCLSKNDYLDFKKECKEVEIDFIRTEGLMHDRFIIIDYDTENEIIYHCGASEKDAGGKIMAISKFEGKLVRTAMREVVERLESNEVLRLS